MFTIHGQLCINCLILKKNSVNAFKSQIFCFLWTNVSWFIGFEREKNKNSCWRWSLFWSVLSIKDDVLLKEKTSLFAVAFYYYPIPSVHTHLHSFTLNKVWQRGEGRGSLVLCDLLQPFPLSLIADFSLTVYRHFSKIAHYCFFFKKRVCAVGVFITMICSPASAFSYVCVRLIWGEALSTLSADSVDVILHLLLLSCSPL